MTSLQESNSRLPVPTTAEFSASQDAAREYNAFLQRKVDAARASIRAGEGIPNEEVEATFAALRAEALRKM